MDEEKKEIKSKEDKPEQTPLPDNGEVGTFEEVEITPEPDSGEVSTRIEIPFDSEE